VIEAPKVNKSRLPQSFISCRNIDYVLGKSPKAPAAEPHQHDLQRQWSSACASACGPRPPPEKKSASEGEDNRVITISPSESTQRVHALSILGSAINKVNTPSQSPNSAQPSSSTTKPHFDSQETMSRSRSPLSQSLPPLVFGTATFTYQVRMLG
jgi:hypothetical protein